MTIASALIEVRNQGAVLQFEVKGLTKKLKEAIEEIKELNERLLVLETARARCNHYRGAILTQDGTLLCDTCLAIIDAQVVMSELEHHELVPPLRYIGE